MAKIALLTIGSELLDGRTLDTNVNFLAKELSQISCVITNIITCSDNINAIKQALDFSYCQGATLVITSGGLGPTTDDLTREAVADFFSTGLTINQDELTKQKKRYQEQGKDFPPSNIKQATFPSNSQIIKNNFGTAPAFILNQGGKSLIALPGVPRELKGIFSEEILPILHETYRPPKIYQKRFVFFDIPESALNDQVSSLTIPNEIELIYEITYPEIKIICKSTNEGVLDSFTQKLRNLPAIEFLISEDQKNLPSLVHEKLIASKKTLAIAESCTGGLIGKILTDFDGSSKYFLGSLVTYHNNAKEQILGVNSKTLKEFGAVSSECALEMALGVKAKMHSDISLSITGVAGPSGGTDTKPVGTVFVAYADAKKSFTKKISCRGSRDQIRLYAAYYALRLLINIA